MSVTKENSLNQVRDRFLKFFEKNGHKICASAPLVPFDDPTLLFVNAGMVPFKNRFTGLEQGDFNRAASSQKCVRAGGKHNDLDNVGYTARHHTFFEMLGNFSFGDYFKDDAIAFAWDMVTKEFSLPKERLLVTVYHDDEQAANIWKKVAGFSDSQIIRIDTNDNFWSMGDTGPCGPCSEIFFDHGDKIAGGPPGSADQDGDRFIEIWNLVFMQYDTQPDGTRLKLPAPSIDTGMGLERITALLQGKHDNYETDIMRAIIETSAHISNTEPDGEYHFSHRILADHLRSAGFLMADGVMPSSEGRGYVLRRIMRRAMRHAHIIGTNDAFMYKLVPTLIAQMGDAYPELKRAESVLTQNFKLEEEAFRKTLARGLDLLDDAVKNIADGGILSGDTAFKLYDTYGFPLDLTQDILRTKNIAVDNTGFETAMTAQKQKARASWTGSGDAVSDTVWFDFKNNKTGSEFIGYDAVSCEAKIIGIVRDGTVVSTALQDDIIEILMDKTPFYATSGGQCGDTGFLTADNLRIEITDTLKKAGEFHVCIGKIITGTLSQGQTVMTQVDNSQRDKIRANHSATHLLHEALRRVLGDGVSQKGSQVTADGLRFDFSYPQPMTQEQITQTETIINDIIRQNSPVVTEILTPDAAIKKGALALFGEKYGDNVRVLFMGNPEQGGKPFSVELCGGTHVHALGDIGLCVITAESGVSSGVRRIEALTGAAALEYLNAQRMIIKNICGTLKSLPHDIHHRFETLVTERKKMEREIADLKQKLALGGHATGQGDFETVNGVKFIGKILRDISPKDIAPLMDAQKQTVQSGVIVLIFEQNDKVGVAVGVTSDLTHKYNASDLVKIASTALGGKGGGGRPDFAQAGGSDISCADDAILQVKNTL